MSTRLARSITIAVLIASCSVLGAASAAARPGLRTGRALAAGKHQGQHRHRHATRPRHRAAGTLDIASALQAGQAMLGGAQLGGETVTLGYGEALAFPLKANWSGTASAIHFYVSARSTATTVLAGVFAS